MIEIIKKYLDEALERARDLEIDCQIDLKDTECIGRWRDEAIYKLEISKYRINELENCLKFLSSNERKSIRKHSKAKEVCVFRYSCGLAIDFGCNPYECGDFKQEQTG